MASQTETLLKQIEDAFAALPPDVSSIARGRLKKFIIDNLAAKTVGKMMYLVEQVDDTAQLEIANAL